MEIIYKQPAKADSNLSKKALLEEFGITGCYFKSVNPAYDSSRITTRLHHHTSCEIHLITQGAQRYLVKNKLYDVPAGHYILIPSAISHRHILSQPDTQKYSITFSCAYSGTSSLAAYLQSAVLCRPLPREAWTAVGNIEAEARNQREYSIPLIECNIFQLLLFLARDAGLREESITTNAEEDPRLSIAKQYILDNIERPITCPEVANYCHLSQKQLSRLFARFAGKSIGAYIRSQKVRRIEQLLVESSCSLKQISEQMQFSNEYHFNSFFSKYAGMTPGAYRKMINHPDYKTSP